MRLNRLKVPSCRRTGVWGPGTGPRLRFGDMEAKSPARSATEGGPSRLALGEGVADESSRDQVPAAVRALVAACDPVRIVLFGSRARGDARPDSDIDLLVIVDDEVEPRLASRAALLAVARLRPEVDVIVVRDSVATVEARRAGTIIRPALREGRVVYSRAA